MVIETIDRIGVAGAVLFVGVFLAWRIALVVWDSPFEEPPAWVAIPLDTLTYLTLFTLFVWWLSFLTRCFAWAWVGEWPSF